MIGKYGLRYCDICDQIKSSDRYLVDGIVACSKECLRIRLEKYGTRISEIPMSFRSLDIIRNQN